MDGKIGERIKLYRETKNMSQQDLSSEANVSLGLIQQIEQGRHNNPSINVLNKIADVLDIDILNLIKSVINTKAVNSTLESLKNKTQITYIPLFDHIPTEAEISLKNISKVKALIPGVSNRAEYGLRLGKVCSPSDPFREKDGVGIRRVKHVKNNCIYLIKTKDEKCYVRRSKIYKNKNLVFYASSIECEPIEYNKNVKVVGEIVRWFKNSLNDSLPGPKITL